MPKEAAMYIASEMSRILINSSKRAALLSFTFEVTSFVIGESLQPMVRDGACPLRHLRWTKAWNAEDSMGLALFGNFRPSHSFTRSDRLPASSKPRFSTGLRTRWSSMSYVPAHNYDRADLFLCARHCAVHDTGSILAYQDPLSL